MSFCCDVSLLEKHPLALHLVVLGPVMNICGNFLLSLFALYPPSTYYVLCRQTIFSHTQAAADVIRGESNLSGVLQKWKEITLQQYLQMHSSQTPSHSNSSRWWLCDLYVVCFELLSNGPYKFTLFYASTLNLEYKRNMLDKGRLVCCGQISILCVSNCLPNLCIEDLWII